MEKFKSITIIFLLAVGLLTSIALAKPAGVLLQEGIYAEEIEGNLNAAIKIYEQIVKDDSAERAHVAQALYRLGLCHLKKQNEQQAKAVFEKLVTQFPEQTSIVDKAQPLLDEMTTPDPAALMPPETLVYLEVGSPGKQLETILNMLKGTPFENPFAVIGGGAAEDAGAPRQKSPGDMMAALLNPSMMAEFKKIRGFAVGLAGVGNNPPGVAILFPGKSDALRGILLAGLSMAGTPGESIEGMQTLRIGGAAGIAYDDYAIIIAQPIERLRWCVKQYKGVTDEPTLASKNKAFKKLSRKVREESALTIWADVDKTFASLAKQFPNGNMPQQFRAIDGIADLENIEDIIARFSIQENRIIVEANVSFKEGHKCLAYDLIRTPNLTRAGFKAVPSDAIALVSLALGESEDARIDTAQKIARNLTGLDIGREIFTNVEQVTLFALPPTPANNNTPLARNISPALPCLGLVVTSHNPQRTRQLLTELLGLANLVTGSQMTDSKSNQAGGKYQIGVVENEAIYCYLGQADKSTILTPSSEVLQACLSAVKSRQTVLTAGPLHQSLSQLSPDISKLALVNIGGVVRVADAHIHREVGPDDNPNNYPLPYSQLLEQLAKTCDNTIVQLRTGEELNNFNVRCSIDELPPLGGVFPVLMQLSRGIPSNLLPCATDPYPADGTLVGPEAELELSWTPGIHATEHRVYFGTKSEKLSLLGKVEEPEFSKLPSLKRDNEYYWRVDEVQRDGSIVKGNVWSFNTGKLVAWWKLDDSSGSTTASDSAGKHTGKLVGMNVDSCWVRGRDKGGLEFDGVDDYVDIDVPGPLEQMTIAMWLKYDTVQGESPMEPDSYSSLISRSFYSDTGSVHFNLINIEGSVFIDFNVNVMMEEFRSESSLKAGTWYHVAATYDNPNKTVKIYVNGQVDSSSTNDTGGPALIGEAAIGDWTGAFYETDRHLDGTLDDIRIYNYALSEDEVAELYKSPNAIRPRPADGAIVGIEDKLELSWKSGINATSHKVYFGTEKEKISLLGKVKKPEFSKLPSLKRDNEYYWRVDEVQRDGSIVKGNIWRFNTGGLIAHWKFDKGQGRIAKDSAGRYDGIVHGLADWESNGQIGGAIALDSGDDYVEVEHIGTFDAVTLAMWINVHSVENSWTSILHNDGWSSNDVHYHLIRDGHFRIALSGSRAESVGEYNEYNPRPLPQDQDSRFAFTEDKFGKWHHIAIVYDSQAKTADFYVNGQLDVRRKYEEVVPAKLGPLRIGSWDNGGREFDGLMDDIRVYNYALSGDEVAGIYKSANPPLTKKAKKDE